MRKMIVPIFLCGLIICALAGAAAQASYIYGSEGSAQKRQNRKKATICGNPKEPCQSAFPFEPYDLQFRVGKNAVIWDTEPFYAVILKSVRVVNNNCDAFVPEAERLRAQELFPDRKVFTSRCPESLEVYYMNVSPDHNFMAVYAGGTRAEANRVLAEVKATGKYKGANIRRMRAGINGT